MSDEVLEIPVQRTLFRQSSVETRMHPASPELSDYEDDEDQVRGAPPVIVGVQVKDSTTSSPPPLVRPPSHEHVYLEIIPDEKDSGQEEVSQDSADKRSEVVKSPQDIDTEEKCVEDGRMLTEDNASKTCYQDGWSVGTLKGMFANIFFKFVLHICRNIG